MFAINKAFLFFLVAVYSLIGLINSCHSATNIALGKPYTISSKPNYSRSAPPTDVSALTDGKFTIGYFWTQKTTLGWRKIRPVEIIIDLGKSFAISSISFSTARRKAAEVYYPENIAAFIGSDKNHWRYVGDIAKNPDNVPGAYQVKKFILNDISAQGRYVFLQIHPKGPYLFCDEIEIHEGKQTNGVAGTLSMNDARNLSEQLRRVGINKRLLTRLVESLKTGINQRPQLTRHLANIEQRIQAATPPLDIVEAIESDLLGLHGEMLRTQYPGKDFLVCPIDPWTKASPVYPVTGHSKVDISLVTPVGGYDTTSFMITNLATKPRQFSFSFADKVTDTSEVFLYQIPFVKSAAMEYVADPLVPLKDNISLRPGESRMVLMAVRGSKAGIWRTSLKVFCDGTEVLIPVESIVTKVAMPRRFTLNSVTWSYLNFKPTRTLKTEAMNDLFAHHTKVVVFHPNDLTLVDQPTRVDFIRMNKTFELNKGADKVLLLMNFRKDRWLTANGKYEFLSDQWKKWFRKL